MHVKFLETLDWSILIAYFLILIAIGIWASIRTIKKSLKDYNILMDSIRAVFITHDHADHIKAVGFHRAE